MNTTRQVFAVIAGFVLLTGVGGAAQVTPPVQPETGAEAATQSIRQDLGSMQPDLEKAYAALEAKVRAMPRSLFERSAVIEQVGRDPAALEKWVADETDLLPYRGALRGPDGVMMDRAGNSLDRSLLLAALLQSSGFEVRLANAKLQPAQAAALASSIKPVRAHRPTVELTPEAKEAQQRVERQSKLILSAMSASVDSVSATDQWAAALSDHWWVQRYDGARWVDADPCKLTPLTPTRTIALKRLDGTLPLDSKDCHEVGISVVIESFNNGKLTTGAVLQQSCRPAEMLNKPLTLYHYTGVAAIGDSLYLSDNVSMKRMKSSILAQEIFLPVLKAGANETIASSFAIDGTINKSPKVDDAGQLTGGKPMAGLISGLSGGASANAPKADLLTAEWIEYEIRVPGETPQHIRRMVFDLIGPAARAAVSHTTPKFTPADKLKRGLVLIGATQITLQPCEMPMQFVAYQAIQQHLREKQVFMTLSKAEFQTFGDLTKTLNRLDDFDMTQPIAMARGMIGPSAARLFIDRPNILNYRLWATELPDGGVGSMDEVDMAFMSNGSLAPAAPAAFADRVTQGVTDTLAEQWGRDPKIASIENTLRLAERAAEEKSAPTTAAKPDDLKPLNMPADVLARAQADLADGNGLVVSRVNTNRFGWWRVSAKTGQTIGVLDDGYNGDMGEYPPLQRKGRPEKILQRMGKDAFNKMSREKYAQVARLKEVPTDEWEFVEQLQGKVREKALTVAEQLAKLKGPIKP